MEQEDIMDRPEIDLIKESLPLVSERVAKGTVTHLMEYIEYLEESLNKLRLDLPHIKKP